MKSRIQKWGTSYAFRISKSFTDELQRRIGTLVEATIQDGKLVIQTLRVPDYDLEYLLKDVTPNDFQKEVTEQPIGNEVW